MNAQSLNLALITRAAEIRGMIEKYAELPGVSLLDAQSARVDFESTLLAALRGEAWWDEPTNADLAAALGHNTLVGFLESH